MKKKSKIVISQIEHIHAATVTSVDMMTKKTQALAVYKYSPSLGPLT